MGDARGGQAEETGEALRARATALVADVLRAAGVAGAASVEWFDVSADVATGSPYRVDPPARSVSLNRGLVDGWLRELPGQDADKRFVALALRAAAALLFAPPAYAWNEAVELHVRTEQDQGLEEDYAWAFAAANTILESHRLDQRVLELIPAASDRLAELVRFDLEAHPAFDVYPRAAIVMGRPNLPSDIAQPAFDEFVDRFGVDEAAELGSVLSGYVALRPDAIDEMVDATADFVFRAFPEAMGLAWDDDGGEDFLSEDIWPLQRTLPEDGRIGWDDLERLVASTLAGFNGEAGLDYGDALLIGLEGAPFTGRRIGAWAGGGQIHLDLTDTNFDGEAIRELLARGWERFGNAPESFQKSVAVSNADSVAVEVMWLLRDLARFPDTGGLTLWGRGAAMGAAHTLE